MTDKPAPPAPGSLRLTYAAGTDEARELYHEIGKLLTFGIDDEELTAKLADILQRRLEAALAAWFWEAEK